MHEVLAQVDRQVTSNIAAADIVAGLRKARKTETLKHERSLTEIAAEIRVRYAATFEALEQL
jgi:hypothetical protein